MKSVVKISILTAIFAIAMFSCDIEGTKIYVENMTIAIAPVPGTGNKVNLGSVLTATVTVIPEDAKNKSVTFISSNPDVISVISSGSGGTLKAEKVGQATITATANDGSGISASITLTVVVPDITVTVSGTNLYTGTAIVPSGANITVKAGDITLTEGKDYTLSYTNNIEVGTATVTATGAGIYAGCTGKANFTIAAFTGSGTSTAPYEIDTPMRLALLAKLVNAGTAPYANAGIYYELTSDINLDVAPYNSGTGWTPIGLGNYGFKGHFYGNNHIVSGLYINNTSLASAGLFGYITNGTVRNVGVKGGIVTGKRYVGGVAGYLNGSSIVNCYAASTVTGNDATGGIVGYLVNSSVTNCYAAGTVNGSNYVGGVVGEMNIGTITNCYAMNTVNGSNRVGGVAGDVNGFGYSKVTNCYVTGTVSGNSSVGGVAGYVFYGSSVAYCVALNSSIARIGSSNAFGRVVGYESTGSAISYNVALIGMTLPSGANGNNGTSITAAEAKTQITYSGSGANQLGWSFGSNDASPWKMSVGAYSLPVFYWQTTAPAAMPTHLQ